MFKPLKLKTDAQWAIKWRRIRWVGHASHTVERRDAYKVVVGKLVGKGSFGRWRCR
jgi:hypothetical protein